MKIFIMKFLLNIINFFIIEMIIVKSTFLHRIQC